MNTVSNFQEEPHSLPKIYGENRHARAASYSAPTASAEYEARAQRMRIQVAALRIQETRLRVGISANAMAQQEWSQVATVMCQSLELVLNHIKSQSRMSNVCAQNRTQAKAYLSPRQIGMIKLIAKGLSNKEISEVLELKQASTNQSLSRIYKVLNVSSRMQAVVKCVQEGII